MKTLASAADGRPDRQAEIFQVALNSFLRDGYAGTSMANISHDLGGSKSTLYHRYRSKKQLFLSVLKHEVDSFFGQIAQGEPCGGDFEPALRCFCSHFAQAGRDKEIQKLHRLVIGESSRFSEIPAYYRQCVDKVLNWLAATIENAVREGHLVAEDSRAAAELLFALNMQPLFLPFFPGDFEAESQTFCERHAALVWGVFRKVYLPACECGSRRRIGEASSTPNGGERTPSPAARPIL